MGTKEEVLQLVLDSFSSIKDIIEDTKDIKRFLKDGVCDKTEVTAVVEHTKTLIDKLSDHSEKIRKKFYEYYVEPKDKNEATSGPENVCNGDLSGSNSVAEGDDVTEKDDSTIEKTKPVKKTSKEREENLESEKDVSKESENCNSEVEPEKINENCNSEVEPEKINENGEENSSHSVAEDIISVSQTEDEVLETLPDKNPFDGIEGSADSMQNSDQNNKETEDENKENIEEADVKPKIRLVDLSKLLDPKPKNVRFDSSVIILSSDDESGATRKPDEVEDNVPAKSAKQTKDEGNNQQKAKDKVPLKSIEKSSSKPENKSKRNREESRSSDESNSDPHQSRKSKKLKVTFKDQHSDDEISLINSDVESSPDGKRTSRRLRNTQNKKMQKKIDLKEKFGRRNKRNDRTTKSHRSSSKVNAEEHLSDTSSLSDEEKEDKSKNEERRKKHNPKNKSRDDSPVDPKEDQKFSYEVYVPLPKIKCERLQDVYLNNKEILEIKRLANLKSLSRKGKNKSESSEKEVKKRVRGKKKEDEQSDEEGDAKKDSDEKSSDESNSESRKGVSSPVIGQDENMADIAVEKLAAEDETNEDKKSDSDDDDDDDKKKEGQQNGKNKRKGKSKDKSGSEKEDGTDKENETDDKSSKSNISDGDDSNGSSKSDKKKKWKKNKLLTEKLNSSDSEEEFDKFCKKKKTNKEGLVRKVKKKIRKKVISDSDDSKKDESSDDEKASSDEKSSSSKSEEEVKKKSTRRIKRAKNSSSSSEDDKSTRKHIRRLIDRDSLSETTKKAEAAEKERKARIAERQKKYNNIFEEKKDATIDKLVLEIDEKTQEEVLAVDPKLVKKLKPHQANGIRFMWDSCFESLARTKKGEGGGCILAHCMGLGKTLQVIALIHTLLKHGEKTGVTKVLVVCPVNTVLNWKAEFKKWIPRNSNLEVFELVSCKKNYERQYVVNEWHTDGGVLIIGYTMFRNLSNPNNKTISKKMRKTFQEGLLDPGADLVICDEGHLLKNEKTHLSIAMNRIKTVRRIVLTGTPLQNNMKEYWCMVQFIKPNLLGTYKEYLNRFVNPITNGQYTDSTQHDLMLMRKRSHVLHKLLDGVVQRRDYAVLEPYLPPKHEYVLFVKLSEVQVKLYKHYMEKFARKSDGSNRTSFLFTDFQQLQRINTHPRVLGDKSSEKPDKLDDEDSEGSLREFIDDGDDSGKCNSSSSSSSDGSSDSDSGSDKSKKKSKVKIQRKTRVTRALAAQRRENDEDSDPEVVEARKEWWQEFCDGEELDNIANSGKLSLFFQILKECEEIGDKVLVFSQSLYTLNCIEYFLDKIEQTTQNGESEKFCGHRGSWALGLDYFRLDGSSSCDNRAAWCNSFNDPDNIRARLFLISTRAGGLGINLIAANRVIIFDVSWNPSHDIQSIYRVYRFGQTKPCYIYRFVTYGAMEMKIYERQVTKQAISKRVIDEQQIDRHYNQNDLQELYKCDLEPEERPIPLVPKDVLLGEMLQKYEKVIHQYHVHQSLLENKESEELNEEERKAAWEEFENEKVLRKNTSVMGSYGGANMNPQLIATALRNIVKRDNPAWTVAQVNQIIPALVQQLQAQLAENDTSMYVRVQQEIQKMQVERMREAYYQQQMRQLVQQQQRQQAMAGQNMYVDPAQMANLVYGNMPLNRGTLGFNQAGPSMFQQPNNLVRPRPQARSNEIIDLND